MEVTNRPPSIPPNFISLQKLQQLRIKEQQERKLKQKEEEELRIKEQEERKLKQKEITLRKVKGNEVKGKAKLQELGIKEQEERKLKQKKEELGIKEQEEQKLKQKEEEVRKVKGNEVKGKAKMLGDEEVKSPIFHHHGRRNKERPLSVKKDGEMSSKSVEQQSVDLEEMKRVKNKETKMKIKLKRKLKMEMAKTLAAADENDNNNVDGKEKEKKLIDEKTNEGVSVNPMMEIVVDEKKVVKQRTEVNRKGSNGGKRRSNGKKTSDGVLKVENVVDDENKKVEYAVEKQMNEVVIGESSRNGGNQKWKRKPNNRIVKKVFANPAVEIVGKIGALTVGDDAVKNIGEYCDKSTVETKVADGEVKINGEDCNRSKVEMNGCDLGFRRRPGYGGRGRGRRDENVMWVKKGENEEEEGGGRSGRGGSLSSGGRRFSGGRGKY